MVEGNVWLYIIFEDIFNAFIKEWYKTENKKCSWLNPLQWITVKQIKYWFNHYLGVVRTLFCDNTGLQEKCCPIFAVRVKYFTHHFFSCPSLINIKVYREKFNKNSPFINLDFSIGIYTYDHMTYNSKSVIKFVEIRLLQCQW